MKIFVNVKPGAREEKIEKIKDNEYKILLKERAEDGKANIKLSKLIAKEFGVLSKNILIKNPRSREKIIEIRYN